MIRGKSLSPTKSKKQFIANGLLTRSTSVRHIALRKQRLALLKTKQQQQANKSGSLTSETVNGTAPMVIPTDGVHQPAAAACAPNENEVKANESSDESEYSSLEDDDDAQGNANESNRLFSLQLMLYSVFDSTDETDDNNSFTESEDNFNDSSLIHNGIMTNGTIVDHSTCTADSVDGRAPKDGPLTPSLFPNVPPYITFVTHEEKGPIMPAAINKILKWKLTTITPIVIRKVLLNSGFRLLKREFGKCSPLFFHLFHSFIFHPFQFQKQTIGWACGENT